MKKDNNLIKKNFIWNVIGSTFSALNSLFFMIIVTRINGVDDAGVFTFAFSTACLFYVIGIYSGRTYQVTDEEYDDNAYFYNRVITCTLMFMLSLVFCFVRGYDFTKISIIIALVLFKVLEAFSDTVYGIIQKNDQLYKVGISLFIKSILGLLGFAVIDYVTKNIFFSALTIFFLNMLVIILYDFKNLKLLKFNIKKINIDKSLMLIKVGFYAFAFSFLTQYLINAPKYSIDSYLQNDIQTIFGIIMMPATVIVLLGQFLIQPFLLKLKNNLKLSKTKFLKQTLIMASIILALGLCFLIGAYLLGIPFLNLIYNIKLDDYLIELLIIIIGATFYGISLIFSTSLTTMRYTLNQLIIYIITSVITFIISPMLVINKGVMGASLVYMFAMLILMIMYIIIFSYSLKKYGGKK